MEKAVVQPIAFYPVMCPGLDSNQHVLSNTTTSKWLVYQFQHLGSFFRSANIAVRPKTENLILESVHDLPTAVHIL
jgi:hypothetical protein